MRLFTSLILATCAATASAADDLTIKPIDCTMCEAWNKPQQPFNIANNTWYVGTAELSALLITGPKGHILLDGALPQSAPQIAQNIESLGFKLKDVKLILNSHAHWDHAGGIAYLQQKTGAKVATSVHGAQVLRNGLVGDDDPQWEPSGNTPFPPVPSAVGVADGEILQVGPITIKAHLTPGHTLGSTTWTWTSCDNSKCLNVVYADSLTPVSSDRFRYTGPRAEQFRRTIDKVANLKCDVIVSTHPDFTDTLKKLAARTPETNPFITPNGCREYAADARQRLDQRLAKEAASGAAASARPIQ